MCTTPPDHPLPLARFAGVAVLGDDDMAVALSELLSESNKPGQRFVLPAAKARQLRFADMADLVFLCAPWDELARHRSSLKNS